MKGSGQAAHLNGVVRIGVSITQGSKMGWAISGSTWTTSSLEACPTIWARHGSTTPTTSRAWSDHRITGSPSLRHPLFGVFVALTAGLPEQIAHIAGTHSAEGEHITRSLAGEIIAIADRTFWRVLASGKLLEG